MPAHPIDPQPPELRRQAFYCCERPTAPYPAHPVLHIGNDPSVVQGHPLCVAINTADLSQEDVVGMLRALADWIERDGLLINTHLEGHHGCLVMDRGQERRAEAGSQW